MVTPDINELALIEAYLGQTHDMGRREEGKKGGEWRKIYSAIKK